MSDKLFHMLTYIIHFAFSYVRKEMRDLIIGSGKCCLCTVIVMIMMDYDYDYGLDDGDRTQTYA